MKIAGRENQKRYATALVASRVYGTEGENNPAQSTRLDVKKKSGHGRSVFFLTPFIELIRPSTKNPGGAGSVIRIENALLHS
jgi:hypothetical protein